jgi:hypothetical protein
MNILKKLFGKTEIDPELLRLTQRSLFVVMQTKNSTFDLQENRDPEALTEWLTDNVEEIAQTTSAKLFEYEEAGLILVPAFTSSENITEWIQQKPFQWNGAVGIGTLELNPGALFPKFAGAPPRVRVILDPKNTGERLLTTQEMKSLSAL